VSAERDEAIRWAHAPRLVAGLAPTPEELRVLRLCDGLRDVDAIVDDARLAHDEVLAIIDRFAERGAITALPAIRERRPLPDALRAWIRPEAPAAPPHSDADPFTGDEEAFFAAPLPDEEPWDPATDLSSDVPSDREEH
jgi:hypothetical protein